MAKVAFGEIGRIERSIMIAQKTYKTQLKPNNKQATLLNKACGVARFTYNWGLERNIKNFEEGKEFESKYDLSKALNAIKKDEFPWMKEVTKSAPQWALFHVDAAFKNFFKRCKNKKPGEKPGFPRFKSKNSSKQSFKIGTDQLTCAYITNTSIKLPKIKAPIRLMEHGYIPTKGVKYNSYTISKECNKWYVSVQVEEEVDDVDTEIEEVIGVDLGIKTLATCSNGETFENPKNYKKHLDKLRRAQRKHSKKKKGSKNRQKAREKLNRIHKKISNKRKDAIHKMTCSLARAKRRIMLEDLNVQGMKKNRCLSQSISDAAFGEIKRQLMYKTQWYGGEVVLVDRWFPSSKLCSNCGHKKEHLGLDERIYKCDVCGLEMDRDLNAAINLENYNTASPAEIKACGDGSSVTINNCSNSACRGSKKQVSTLG